MKKVLISAVTLVIILFDLVGCRLLLPHIFGKVITLPQPVGPPPLWFIVSQAIRFAYLGLGVTSIPVLFSKARWNRLPSMGFFTLGLLSLPVMTTLARAWSLWPVVVGLGVVYLAPLVVLMHMKASQQTHPEATSKTAPFQCTVSEASDA